MTVETSPTPYAPSNAGPAATKCAYCDMTFPVQEGAADLPSRVFQRDLAFQQHAINAHPDKTVAKPTTPPDFVAVKDVAGNIFTMPQPQAPGGGAQPLAAQQAQAALQQAGFPMPQPANTAPQAQQAPQPQAPAAFQPGQPMTSAQLQQYLAQNPGYGGPVNQPTAPYQAHAPQAVTGPGGVGGTWIGDSASDRSAAQPGFVGQTPQGGGGLSHHNIHLFAGGGPSLAPPASAYVVPRQGYAQERVHQSVDGVAQGDPNAPQAAGAVMQGLTPPVILGAGYVHQAENGRVVNLGPQQGGRPVVQGQSQNAPGGDPNVPLVQRGYSPNHVDPATGLPPPPPASPFAPYGWGWTGREWLPMPPPPPPALAPQQVMLPAPREEQEEPLLELLSANGDLVPIAVQLLEPVVAELKGGVSTDKGERARVLRNVKAAHKLLQAAFKE